MNAGETVSVSFKISNLSDRDWPNDCQMTNDCLSKNIRTYDICVKKHHVEHLEMEFFVPHRWQPQQCEIIFTLSSKSQGLPLGEPLIVVLNIHRALAPVTESQTTDALL